MSIRYAPVEREDIETIIALTEEHLMHGERIGESIRESVAEGNYYGVKAVEDGKIVAFVTCKKGIELTCPHPEAERRLAECSAGKTVFTGDALYVARSHRNRGIGTQLQIRDRELQLSLGGTHALLEVWRHPDGRMPSGHISHNYGELVFQEYIPEFYREAARFGMECPLCGSECKCGAELRLFRLRRE